MHELLERLYGELLNAWRFRWQGFAAVWFVALIGWAFTFSVPNQYSSWAKVHVDTQYVLRPLLSGMVVEPNLNEAVQLLTRTILSRQNLEQIANNANLDMGGLSPAQKDQLLSTLHAQIHISGVGNDLYVIRYANHDPAIAKAVVQQVLNILMADALGATQEDSASAQKFLREQLASYGNELNQAEQALANFKRENLGYMPSSGGDYVSQLQAAQQQKSGLLNRLDVARSELKTLNQQVVGMKNGKSPVKPQQDPNIVAMDAQIQKDQQRLNSLLTQYTSVYPGVISLQERIALEKRQRNTLLNKLKQSQTDTFDPNSPIYQDVSMQANKVSVEIQGLKTKLQLINAQIADLKRSADKMADVQVKLDALTRNYQVTKGQYNQLLQRLYSAKLSQSAQASGNPLKFQVIDPPLLPRTPISPQRHRMAFLAMFAAIGAGIALAYLLAQLKPVFLTKAELMEMFSIPVIGAVSLAQTSSYLRAHRVRLLMFGAGCAFFMMVGVVAILFSHQGAVLVRVHLLGGTL